MGRRLFQEVYASQERTDALGLPELLVVSEADDPETADLTYHVVRKSYFSKEKQICPYCQGANTAETKIRSRKFKDILPSAVIGFLVRILILPKTAAVIPTDCLIFSQKAH